MSLLSRIIGIGTNKHIKWSVVNSYAITKFIHVPLHQTVGTANLKKMLGSEKSETKTQLGQFNNN